MIGRYKRKWIEQIAERNKASFLQWQQLHVPAATNESAYTVVSFSGAKWFADQLYSLYSFYYNVGKPQHWLIYNDGTYSKTQLDAFRKIDRVTVCDLDISDARLPKEALQKFPTLKKVEIVTKHISVEKTIISDSDILFYRHFSTLINSDSKINYYLVDEGNRYLDKDFLLANPLIEEPFNFGLLLLHSRFSMDSVYTYIEERYRTGELDYWSDQTAFQKLVMNDAGFEALDRELFKVGGSDSFHLSHCVDYNKIALRHFVGPVRHKMWQYPWKKVLGLKL
jgi:hypothetical protein